MTSEYLERRSVGKGAEHAAPNFSLTTRRTWPKSPHAQKPGTNPKGEFVFFNVIYEDGSQRSPARAGRTPRRPRQGRAGARCIIEQDREIAEKSGRPPLKIKSLDRTDAKKRRRGKTSHRRPDASLPKVIARESGRSSIREGL